MLLMPASPEPMVQDCQTHSYAPSGTPCTASVRLPLNQVLLQMFLGRWTSGVHGYWSFLRHSSPRVGLCIETVVLRFIFVRF